ncbi:hypothetical protein PWG71_17320 [Nocardiopsis sp. N85]|uniref:hypothetical protein n=1 Tax=Nocardiopsis sp. N85 TaxID=3029400 RepID=UPI00237EF885|nr:hypothetical protein [Nocardiopsis sp. N85]MDE3723155.1 hypothetical protein [Nocardiopsis sp. N85]
MRRRPIDADDVRGASTVASGDRVGETVVLGCHGGAGTTTLAALLGTPWDLGSYTPERDLIAVFGRPLILVSRDGITATARLAEVLNVLERNGLRPAALVVVADGSGPEPPESSARLRLVGERVGSMIRFPFVPGLRYVDATDAARVALPRKASRALARITMVTGTPVPHPAG